jgi:hypothetical protein
MHDPFDLKIRECGGMLCTRRALIFVPHEGVPEESERKQRASKNGTNEIDIVPSAGRLTQPHRWKQVKRLGNMRKHDYAKAS